MYISIVIPVYNRESEIIRCLNSISDKFSSSDFEVILIDDCSTDKSAKIIEEMMPSFENVQFFKHKTNRGVNAARNLGIKSAVGEWIVFLDSDDQINIAEHDLRTYLEEFSGYDIISARCVTEDGQLVGKPKLEFIEVDYVSFLEGKKSFETIDILRNSKNLWDKFPENVNGFEGIGWARLLKQGMKILILPVIARTYHQNSGNQLTSRSVVKRSGDLARGYGIYLAENYASMSAISKFKNLSKRFCYLIISKIVAGK